MTTKQKGIVYPEAEALKQYRYRQVEFAADKVRFTGAKDEITGEEDTLAGTFKLDPAKNPMQIEMTLGNPDEYRRMLTGILLVERDTLKLFLAEPQEESKN